jgi:vesicle coat complex subunit
MGLAKVVSKKSDKTVKKLVYIYLKMMMSKK